MKRTVLTRDQILEAMTPNGTKQELAQALGVEWHTVRYYMNKYGIKRPEASGKIAILDKNEKDVLRRIEEGEEKKAIAESYGTGSSTLYQWLKTRHPEYVHIKKYEVNLSCAYCADKKKCKDKAKCPYKDYEQLANWGCMGMERNV